MNVLKKIRRLTERLTGLYVDRYSSSIIQIIPRKKLKDAWFLQPALLRSLFHELQVDLILDVGGNRGSFPLAVREFYKGPIVSFEPVTGTFAILKQIASRDKNWSVFNYALGNESGERHINTYGKDVLNSLLKMSQYGIERFRQGAEKTAMEPIQIRRLDDIAAEIPFDLRSKRIFLKIDTQGYDLEVFKGAREVLKNVVVIHSQLAIQPIYDGQPHWTDVIREYEKAGFHLAALYPFFRQGYHYTECNCIMVKD
jgi:FkbM family methyltransferase